MVVGALAAPAAAQAVPRYAEPGMGGSDPTCPQADPCDLQTAVESALGGDEVVVTPGTYEQGADPLEVPADVDVHGTPGAARPVITSSAGVDASTSNARVADLTIFGSNSGLTLDAGSLGERLYVVTTPGTACSVIRATLRDSVCWAPGPSGDAILAFVGNAPLVATTVLRNVTAVATGAGSYGLNALASGPGADHTVDARNVIADGVEADVRAFADFPTDTTTVTLANSNYADTQLDSVGGAPSVTPAGTGSNQSAAPGFVNPAAGDFHQSPNSVTVDAGASDSQLGSRDIDGDERIQGDAPDIGADELTDEGAPPPASDTFPPDTGIRSGPKKKYPKRKVTFEFGGSEPGVTFECRLDVGSRQGTFTPCTSPHEIRGLKRKTKYVFAVRAVDAAGNPDPTPADRRWKVTKKKRHP